MKRPRAFGLLSVLLLVPGIATAKAPRTPVITFSTHTLANGMRLIVAPDRAVPVATLAMVVPVGSRQESRGRSGFAHLFEHLMFEGSAHVPKGRFDKILEGYGADNNAWTSSDFTYFYETMPSNVLPVAAWLEADRLSALDVSGKNMRNQVSVVKEEKLRNVENEPYARLLWVEIASRTFSNWANAHDSYGLFEDLDAADLKDVRKFFADHYAPGNVIMAVAGKVRASEARDLLARYLEWIPNRGAPPPADLAEPAQDGERTFTVRDRHAKVPGVAVVWSGMPERRSPAYYALTHLGRLLFVGKSARLYQLLVKEEQVATAVDEPFSGGLGFPVTDWEDYRAPGLFGGFILHKPGVAPERIKELVYQEVSRIAREGVGADELTRVKTKFRSDWIVGRQTSSGRAYALLKAAVLDGDPTAANGELERFLSVSSADIKLAAEAHLRPAKANIFVLRPVQP